MADFEKINRSIDAGQDLVQASFESTVDTQDDEIGLMTFVKSVDDFQAKIEKLKISDDKKLAIFGDLDVFFKTEVITHLPLESIQQMEEIGLALEQKLALLDEEAAPKQGTQNEKKVSDIVPDFGLDLLQQTVAGIKDSYEDAQALEAANKELLNNGIEGKTIEQNRATVEACQRQLERLGVQVKVQSEKITALNKILSSENLAEAVRHNSSVAANTTDIISQGIHIMNMARDKSAKINESIQTTEKEIKKILDLMYVSAYFEAKQSGDSERVDRILIAAFDRLGADIPPQLKDVVEAAKMRAADAAARSDASDNAVFDALYYSGNYAAALRLFAQKNKENAALGEGLLKYSASEISEAFNESTTTRAKENAEASRGIEKNSPAGKKLADGYVRLLFPQDTKANRYGLRLGRVLTLAKKLPDGTIAVSCFDSSGQLRRLKEDVSFSVSPADVIKSEKDEKFIQENVDKVMAKMPSFKALSKAATTVQSKFEPMQKLFVAGKEGHMPVDYVENVKNLARILKSDNGMDDLKANLAAAKEDLAILRQIPAGQRGKFEQQLEQMEAAYSKAIKIIENDTVNDFCSKILSAEFTEDTLAEWMATEGTVMLSTIVGAVMATALTFGAGGIVVASAAGALGGIVGSEVGHVVAEKVSGHEYRSRLGTTLTGGKVWNHATGTFEKLTATDLATMYGGDFARNFVSTLTIVGLGKMANGVLLKFAEANLQNPGVKGTLARISELVFNLKPVEIDLLKKTGKLEKIFHHLIAPVGEEVGEEGISIALAQLNNDYADMVSLFFAMRGGRASHKVDGQEVDSEVQPTQVEEGEAVRVTNSGEAVSSPIRETVAYPSSRESDAVNRVFEGGMLGIGRDNPISLKTNPSSAYRSTGMSQINDIVECGFVRPPIGKLRGGRRGEVHWSRGNERLFYYSKSPIIEIDVSKVDGNKKGAVSLADLKAVWMFNEASQRYENVIDELRSRHDAAKRIEPTERGEGRARRAAKKEARANDPDYAARVRANYDMLNTPQGRPALEESLREAGILKDGESLANDDFKELVLVHEIGGTGATNLLAKRRHAENYADTKNMTPDERAQWRRIYEHALEEGFCGSETTTLGPLVSVRQEVRESEEAKGRAGGFISGLLDRFGIKQSPERKAAELLKDMEGRGDPDIMKWLHEGTSERGRPMTPELRLEVTQMYKDHLDDVDAIRSVDPSYEVNEYSYEMGRYFTIREKCEATKRYRAELELRKPSSNPSPKARVDAAKATPTEAKNTIEVVTQGYLEKNTSVLVSNMATVEITYRSDSGMIIRLGRASVQNGKMILETSNGKKIQLSAGAEPIFVGRILDPTLPDTVSSQHCRLFFNGSEIAIKDVSTNGTHVKISEALTESALKERNSKSDPYLSQGLLSERPARIDRIMDSESQKVMRNLEIHGDAYQGQMLTPALIQSVGLGPKEKLTLGKKNFFVSEAFNIPEPEGGNRIARLLYCYDSDVNIYVVRTIYRSNSQGNWRLLPQYSTQYGEISHYSKGYDESSINLPIALLEQITKLTENPISTERFGVDSFFIFAGTAREKSPDGRRIVTYHQEVNNVPEYVDGNFEVPRDLRNKKQLTPPEQVRFGNPYDEPNFSRAEKSFTVSSELYGGPVTMEVFLSYNGKYRFTMCRDKYNRAWLGPVERTGDILTQSTGLNAFWVNLHDLQTPAFEYGSQSYGWGNNRWNNNGYVDMFANYLSKIPLIQRYYTDRRIQMPRY